MIVNAPAKINLTLRVLGKRPDGYHALESVMQMLTLSDQLSIDVHEGTAIDFTCSDPCLACEENLVVRAARLLQTRCPRPRGAHIHLEKRIPAQAGLGGGSSDAASTLMALNEMWEVRVTPDELATLAAQLGSDVPFFIGTPTAVVRGRGETVEPVSHGMTAHIVLAKPSAGLSTPDVYTGLQAKMLSEERLPGMQTDTNAMAHALVAQHLDGVAGALVNDLEGPALVMLPSLQRLRERMLEEGCLNVLLCGSGSAVFGICADETTARRAAANLTNDAPWTWAGPWQAYR